MNNIYTNAFPYILSTAILIGGYLVYKHWPTIKRILAVLAVAVFVLTGGYLYARGPEIKTIQKIVEVPRAKEDLDELMQEIPAAYGVAGIVANNIVKQESNGNMDSIRFEPSQMSRAAKITSNQKCKECMQVVIVSYRSWDGGPQNLGLNGATYMILAYVLNLG